jgi:two-component system chemotaxis response regulator CheY
MTKKVLIVDDVAFVRKTLAAILSEHGFEVIGEAASGPDAIELFQRIKPDLVTMDIVMPRMSGIEATRKIIRINPEARVVMISAMGQETLVMESIHAGARDYILKPFSAREVVKTLENCLGHSSSGTPLHKGEREKDQKLG